MATATAKTERESTVYTERSTCRACGNSALEAVIDLGDQFLPTFVKEPNAKLPRAPLELGHCKVCGLLQLMHTVKSDLMFRDYWYRSGINQSMGMALGNVVFDGLKYHKKGVWVDIGANDGTLLRGVPAVFQKIAFEPAKTFADELSRVADMTVMDYFKPNPDIARTAQVVTSIAMFYDLDDPGKFIDGVRDTLAPGGIWINQLNDSPTMVRQNAFDSICHEHLCYYDVPTLVRLYEDHGMSVTEVTRNDVNGGSVRVTAMRSQDAKTKPDLSQFGSVTREECVAFAARVMRWKDMIRYMLSGMAGRGRLWCYGASTKGTVLLQYSECGNFFEAVADRNKAKHGLRMAGTWLSICSEDEFREAKPRAAMVLPWAFRSEFVAREKLTRQRGTALIFPLPEIEVVV